MFDVIPAIDLLNGQVVRLRQGDYRQVQTFDYSPAELAKQYVLHRAQRIHVVDLDGAKAGHLVNLDAIKAIREAVDVEIEVGGGIRTESDIRQLLDLGVTDVVLGSILVKNPTESHDWIRHFPDRMIAGIDAWDDTVKISGWTESGDLPVIELLTALDDLPLSAIIFTDISKDGMMAGPNLTALKEVCEHTRHRVIASGGLRNRDDIEAIKKIESSNRVAGCIVGKAVMSDLALLDTLIN